MTFRYIGIEHFVADQKLSEFGQAIELPESEGVAAIKANVPMLPDSAFEKVGFTADELEQYKYPGPRSECSEEFAAKWKVARVALHNIREQIKAGGALSVEGGE